MDKARRFELKMLKFKKRLKNYGLWEEYLQQIMDADILLGDLNKEANG